MSNPFSLGFIRNGDIVKATHLVMLFYYLLFFLSVSHFLSRLPFRQVENPTFSPPWPLFWAKNLSYQDAYTAVIFLLVFSSLCACLYYRHRLARVLALIGAFELAALFNSSGTTYHQWDMLVWIALLFAVAPNAWGKDDLAAQTKEMFLTLVWGAQALFLLIYTMAGLWKLQSAAIQLFAGETSIFSPQSPALHIAEQLLRRSDTFSTALDSFIVNHAAIAWVALMGVLYLQLCAFWVAFRPNLHRLWGLGLAAFHTGMLFAFGVMFFPHPLIAIFLLADSPFRTEGVSWRQQLQELPLFGLIFRRIFT